MFNILIAFVISFWFDLSFTPCILVVLTVEFLATRYLGVLLPRTVTPVAPKPTKVWLVSSGEVNEGSEVDCVFFKFEDAEAKAIELVNARFNFGKKKAQRIDNRWTCGVDFIRIDEMGVN